MPYNNRTNVYFGVLLFLFMGACATHTEAPVSVRSEKKQSIADTKKYSTSAKKKQDKKSGYHIIIKGDTLYSIAWNYGFDYRAVARWNGITAPYVIYPGQFIRLQAPPETKAKPLKPGPIVRKKTVEKPEQVKPDKKPPSRQKIVSKQKPRLPSGKIHWSWPAKGKLIKSDTPTAKKGIDIAGRPGQQVKAAAMGDVVYSGSGLLGYGKLIIIKHNETFLSAYAHNKQLMVKEGERVKPGQHIAQIGQTTNGQTLLHFEIRKDGKPVNPLNYLPKK
ncbi:MAG: peptidoglycan DD-metalloendopeptidase family protein [Gammaproteobacteria bacterium]